VGAHIGLEQVRVVLGDRVVLEEVSAAIAPGEFIVVLGPNGAGKTTLLRVLLGLQRISGGRVVIDGRPPGRGSPTIGYVPQSQELDRDLPVRGVDLVGLGWDGARWGVPLVRTAARRRRVATVLRDVDATSYAAAPVGQLSGGELQRLRLAQALVTEPTLLLLDEPLANLDLRQQQAMVALLARLAARGTTIVLVAHDVNPLLGVLDRVWYLAGGHALLGPVETVIQSDVLSELYGAPVDVFHARGRVFVAASLG
jgi:zinc/manganese transport system ATP-binding protein